MVNSTTNSIDANTKKPQMIDLKQLTENFWRLKLLKYTKNGKQREKKEQDVFHKQSKESEGHKKS